MLDSLYALLAVRTSVELAALIRYGFIVLYDIGYKSHETDLQTLVMTADNQTSESLIMNAVDILNTGLNECLSEHQLVFVFNDNDLRMKIDAVKALMTLTDMDDFDHVLSITDDSDMSADEAMCHILAYVTPYPAVEWFTRIDTVSFALISAISDLMHSKRAIAEGLESEAESEYEMKRVRARERAKAYKNSLQGVTLFSLQTIADGVKPGRPIAVYKNAIEEQLLDIDKSDPASAAQNLMLVALLSDVPDDRVLEETQILNEQLYDIGGFQEKVHGKLIEEYQRLSHANT